ncbi:MAG: L-ribulose-5-phosphate 3-epimerase [Clostridia bacterium]|nr:L-ribulose-5-phosphate 3-epimerase [Clostridia bacterium]
MQIQYRLGLYEKSMPTGMSWRDMLCATKAAGFDQLEISIDETDARLSRLDWSAEERLELVRTEAQTGVPIRTMCLSGHRKYPLGSRDPEIRRRGMEIMEKAIEFSCDTGVRVIQLAGYDVYYEEGGEDTRALFAENLAKSVEIAARHGVAMGFETMETPFMDTVSKGMAYVNDIDSLYLGMYPDLGNLTNACELYGLDVAAEIRAGKGHTYAMHLKETVPGKYRDMDFGDGRVDFVNGVKQALGLGIRLFTAEFWHDGSADWQDRLSRTNRFVRDRIEEAARRLD